MDTVRMETTHFQGSPQSQGNLFRRKVLVQLEDLHEVAHRFRLFQAQPQLRQVLLIDRWPCGTPAADRLGMLEGCRPLVEKVEVV